MGRYTPATTEEELNKLIADHEADRVEFTISTKDTDKFSEAVCAFANDLPKHDRPGHLVVGVDDGGWYAGMPISEELLRNLGGLRDDGNIQPLPAVSVEKIIAGRGKVAVDEPTKPAFMGFPSERQAVNCSI